jgi:hypothetical protein
VSIVVGVRHVMQGAQPLPAPHVATPDQEDRRGRDPVHRADPVGDLLDARFVAHHHDRILLQIRLGRGRLGRGQQRVQQGIGDVLFGITTRDATIDQGGNRVRDLGSRQIDAVAGGQQCLGVGHNRLPWTPATLAGTSGTRKAWRSSLDRLMHPLSTFRPG